MTVVGGEKVDFVVSKIGGTTIIEGITFITLFGGNFRMGNIQEEGGSGALPVHEVTLSGFEMSIHEITQGQYKAIAGSNPSELSGNDDLPVEQVSWYDAAKFLQQTK